MIRQTHPLEKASQICYYPYMWHLYIIECSDGTFYTGITKDVPRRLAQHDRGKASRYTRTRTPVKLVYQERHPDRASASKRELLIKKWSRAKKEALCS